MGILLWSLRGIGRESEICGHEVLSVFAFRSDGTQDGIWAPDTTRVYLIAGKKRKIEDMHLAALANNNLSYFCLAICVRPKSVSFVKLCHESSALSSRLMKDFFKVG